MDVPFPVARNAAICGTYKRPISAACGYRARLLSRGLSGTNVHNGQQTGLFCRCIPPYPYHTQVHAPRHALRISLLGCYIPHTTHSSRGKARKKIVCIAMDKQNRHLCLAYLLQRRCFTEEIPSLQPGKERALDPVKYPNNRHIFTILVIY